ncbi:hypothetical protein BGZ65_000875 [Modicella reniformis]|uniref:Uncharacterized protein n=1 Tax=Modicella reniformis TaxID=1440133 RepID=A0A9P6MA71_9FUNG|nr:hypothetical protein BGZ65_000875 [Modicella reniformis]
MRISSFLPAVLALTFFSASQAGSVESGKPLVSAIADIFIKVHAKAVVDVCAKITADICADVDLIVESKTSVLGGLITSSVDVDKIRVSAKAELDVDIKAKVKAIVDARVLLPIEVIVADVVAGVCPTLEKTCIVAHAATIVAKVNAKIDVNISKVWVEIKAELPAHIRLRAKIIVRELSIHAGLVDTALKVRVWIASNINIYVKVWAKIYAQVCARVKIVALIKAL